MPHFRIATPSRTCTKTYISYRRYKKYLIVDFSNRCGWCDGSDIFYGGYRSFHIDHFAPKSKFPDLENDYSNLIYACPTCNNAKSDAWPSEDAHISVVDEKGFVDPVIANLNEHFSRDEDGNIFALTKIGEDMVSNLNLALPRHGVLWMLSSLGRTLDEYVRNIDKLESQTEKRTELIEAHYALNKVYNTYWKILKDLNS